jgi:antitoxin component of RelBE/YafQ-DinJ toxin-antitoxin module
MDLTLSVDENTVDEARKTARSMGMSLDDAIRGFLAELASRASIQDDVEELRELSLNSGGNSNGWRFNRCEIHERA